MARMVAVAALALALVAVGLAAWQLIATPGSCQQAAWDVEPDAEDLPADWALSAVQYQLSQKILSYLGPID